MKAFVKKEWLLAMRQLHEILQPLFFIVILATLFPLAIGADKALLPKIAPGVIWIAVLLSVSLASERCYKSDFEDGTLEQLFLSGRSLLVMVGAKALVLWCVQILPLLAILPLLGLIYNVPSGLTLQLALTVLIGSPTLLLLGMLGSAVTLSMARSGTLLILIILPLYIPTLIFALSAINAYAEGFSNRGQLFMLGALLMVVVVVAPFAIVAAIRVFLSER